MKLTITNKKENKLLARMEVQGQIVFTATTPSNNDVALALSQELKVDLQRRIRFLVLDGCVGVFLCVETS